MMTKVLVTVMTYPSLSNRYFETVCTAGFRKDGTWIRIYPIPYRLMIDEKNEKRYSKWQWIEADLEQNSIRDDRPESYHIRDIQSLKILDRIDVKGKPNWYKRKEWVFKGKKIFNNLSELLDLTKDNLQSLAVLKPAEILDLKYSKVELSDYKIKLATLKSKYEADKLQTKLFEEYNDQNENFIFAEKIPYRFKYRFRTEDGQIRNLTIGDWELGMCYRNCFLKTNNEIEACEMVKKKFMGLAKNDLYFFLGTTYKWQKMNAEDPYMIIGVFYPPKANNMPLFPGL
jgi:hypothetical protein